MDTINQKKNRVSVMLSDGTLAWIDKHKSFFGCSSVPEFIKYAVSKEIESSKKQAAAIREHPKKWGYEY
jgi:hypothetical protein